MQTSDLAFTLEYGIKSTWWDGPKYKISFTKLQNKLKVCSIAT